MIGYARKFNENTTSFTVNNKKLLKNYKYRKKLKS